MRCFRIALVLLLPICTLACATSQPSETFVVDNAVGFTPVAPSLHAYLVKKSANKGQHHFCVIGYIQSSGDVAGNKIAWVKWAEGNRLILWEPAGNGFESKDTLIHSRRSLDLTKDIVATQKEIGSSTFLETREWVNAVEKDCQKRGKNYQIIAP